MPKKSKPKSPRVLAHERFLRTGEYEWPASMEWEEHIKTSLARYQKGFEDGHREALMDAAIFCVQTRTPMNSHEFPGRELSEFLLDQIKSIKGKKQGGHPIDWAADWQFLCDMDFWLSERRRGDNGKSGPFTLREAAQKVHDKMYPRFPLKKVTRDGRDPIRALVDRYRRLVRRFYSEKYECSDWAF